MGTKEIQFRNYDNTLLEGCLNLFDANCPQFFAINERKDYLEFLQNQPMTYEVGFYGDQIAAVFGMSIDPMLKRGRISWIMVSPLFKGQGVGGVMMSRVKHLAGLKKIKVIDIAASHLSAPFFAKFGAKELKTIQDGWGPDMHRINMELKMKPL
jgi:GNAT superfamily N-acetyltransferase